MHLKPQGFALVPLLGLFLLGGAVTLAVLNVPASPASALGRAQTLRGSLPVREAGTVSRRDQARRRQLRALPYFAFFPRS